MEVELKCQALQLECRTLKKAASDKGGGRPLDLGKALPAPSCFVDLIAVNFFSMLCFCFGGCFCRKAFLGMMWSLFYLLQELQDTKAALRGLANCCCFGDLGLMGFQVGR